MNGNRKITEKDGHKYEIYIKARNVVYYILGILEVLFALRFIFKFLGANPASGLTIFIYNITGIFLAPFSGIFTPVVTRGIEASSVLEPAVIIAAIIYALLARGITRFIEIIMFHNSETNNL